MSNIEYFNKSSYNDKLQVRSRFYFLLSIICCMLIFHPASVVFAGSSSTFWNEYTFVLDYSHLLVYQTDGYNYTYSKTFLVGGNFDFYGTSTKGYFTDSDAVVIDPDTSSPVEFLHELFNLFGMEGNYTGSTTISFTGKTTDGNYSDILLNVNFSDDYVYLVGQVTPDPPSPYGYYYTLEAVAKRKYGGGIGTFEYPYLISTAEHMNTIGLNQEDWSCYFKLTNDINLSGYKNSFNIIGYYNNENDNKPFTGVFNGFNKKIKNFNYEVSEKDRVGLFGYINKDTAEIYNLGIVDPNISSSGGKYIGALVGHLKNGDITNCHVTGGLVSGSDMVGGLIGWNNITLDFSEFDEELCKIGKIAQCSSDANVVGNNKIGGLIGLNDGVVTDCNSTQYADVNGIAEIGGLVGSNDGIIIDCNMISSANITGNYWVGGMVGINTGTVIKCLSSGDPNVIGLTEIGGFVGLNDGFISDCNTTGQAEVSGQNFIGGFAGTNEKMIFDCNTMSQTSAAGQYQIGGFAGLNLGWIEGCNSTSIVSGENQIGGLVGLNCNTITTCSSTSTVSGDKRVGGLAGRNIADVNDSVAEGSVLGIEDVGGLTGINDGYVNKCYSFCTVDGTQYIGGFAGTNNGTVKSCYSEGNISGEKYASGGAGKNYLKILNCASEAIVEIVYDYAGGLAGKNESKGWIENSYATGNVSGAKNVGGLLGYNDGVVFKCYSTGKVTDNYNDDKSIGFGGLIGDSTEQACAIISVWDTQTSQQTISAGGTGKTTAEMKNKTTFADWGKTSVDETGEEAVYWTINQQQGSKDYPRLSWEELPGDEISAVFITDIFSGSGKTNDPFLIDSPVKLNSVGLFPHEWDKNFKLTTNINMSGYTGTLFNLIGYYRIPFAGVFDGNSKVISNLSFNSGDQSYVGLFGCIGSYLAQVKNIGMSNVTVTAKDNVAALTGYLKEGTIQNCYAENVNIAGRDSVAGLVGYNHENIIGSHSTGDVTGQNNVGGLVGNNDEGAISQCNSNSIVSGDSGIGGLAGSSSGSIEDCESSSTIIAMALAGGIAGNNTGTIDDTSSSGYVSGNERIGGLIGNNKGKTTNSFSSAVTYGDLHVGGLIGYNEDADVISCYALGNVLYGRLSSGGLIGYNAGAASIQDCYSDNSVNGSESIGGLIGENEGSISKCYSLGTVSGTTDTGGLVGWNWEQASVSNSYSQSNVYSDQWAGGLIGINNGSIAKCYSSGIVSGKKYTVGGLVAMNYGSSSDSFWDTETSGQTESAAGAGKTTANMKKKATYTSAGWDFTNTWEINENQDYPELK